MEPDPGLDSISALPVGISAKFCVSSNGWMWQAETRRLRAEPGATQGDEGVSEQQDNRREPEGLDQPQRGQCPSQLRGQSGDCSMISSGPKPSLSSGLDPSCLDLRAQE